MRKITYIGTSKRYTVHLKSLQGSYVYTFTQGISVGVVDWVAQELLKRLDTEGKPLFREGVDKKLVVKTEQNPIPIPSDWETKYKTWQKACGYWKDIIIYALSVASPEQKSYMSPLPKLVEKGTKCRTIYQEAEKHIKHFLREGFFIEVPPGEWEGNKGD